MSLKRESTARSSPEPSFQDVDVDHHEPRGRRRLQQQQQARDDVVIIVSDSDTEDEADEKQQDTLPLSQLITSNTIQTPPASSPKSSVSTASSSSAVASITPLPTAKHSAPQQRVSASASAPSPSHTAPATARPTAVNAGNGHKRAAVELFTSSTTNSTRNTSASTSSSSLDDDMPPLIPPPPPPPSAPLRPTAVTESPPTATYTPSAAHSALLQHAAATASRHFASSQPTLVIPHTPPFAQQPPPPAVNGYNASPSSVRPPPANSCAPSSPPSHTSLPNNSGLDPSIALFLQSLLGHTITKPLIPHCFACQCALSLSPTSAADSSFCCPICRTHYHSRCALNCPRHNCHACLVSSSGKGIEARQVQPTDLYQCLLCPRSYCFAHASTAVYSFSSLPAIANLPSYSPTLLTALVGAVLHNGDVASWCATVAPSQIGVCRFCASDMNDEEQWRQLQAKRRMRSITAQM